MTNPDALFEQAKTALQSGNTALAADLARQTAALAPMAWPAHYLLATAERANGRLDAARDAFEAALALAPAQAQVRRAYGDLLLDLGWRRHADGEGDAAHAALTRAIDLAPDDARPVRALAELETDRGGDAPALFARAAALAPADRDAALAHAASRGAEGIDTLRALAVAAPGWLEPLTVLAKIAVADGRPELAAEAFGQALADRPRDAQLWAAWLGHLSRRGDQAAVLCAVDQARAHLGDTPYLRGFAAVALDETGDHAAAAPVLAHLDASGAFGLPRVRHLLRTGDIEAAAARALAGVAQADGRAFWPYLATAWRMLGDPRWTWLEAPAFVQAVDLADGGALAADVAPMLRSLHRDRAAPLGQTLRGGSQTEGRLFLRAEPAMQRLVSTLRGAIEAYAAALPDPEPGHPLLAAPRERLRFAGSWSVRLTDGGLHVNHVHPDGWLSSAFYVALPSLADGSDAGSLVLGEPPAELNLGLAPFRTVIPKPGRLALFPSYTWHGTRPFAGGERLTVAFDVAAT